MLKVFVASDRKLRDTDFCDAEPNELVSWTGYECSPEYLDDHQCKKSLAGIRGSLETDSELGKRTSVFKVVEIDMDTETYVKTLCNFFAEMGWDSPDSNDREWSSKMEELGRKDAEELLFCSNFFNVGDLVGLENGDTFSLLASSAEVDSLEHDIERALSEKANSTLM